MWNRRKEEEYAPPPKPAPAPLKPAAAPTTPTPADTAKEGIAMSTMPTRMMEPEPVRSSATIGKSVMIKGQIYSREDLVIDGDVEGTVELQEHRLTVGPNGKVAANGNSAVKAREIVVLGAIQGNVEAADKIEIRRDAKLVGDIKTARIVIEDGAYFKGSIDIVKPEVAKASPAAVKPAPVAASTPVPVVTAK